MSSVDSPQSTNNRKLTLSFSSPEFDSNVRNNNASNDETLCINNNNNNNNIINTVCITTSNSSQMIKSLNTTGIKLNTTRDSGFSDSIIEDNSITTTITNSSSVKTFHSPTHKFGGDFNNKRFVTRTEHVLNVTNPNTDSNNTDLTLLTKCYTNKGRLKSVEEDINIIRNCGNEEAALTNLNPDLIDETNKEFITIVKTTKVTTKIKQVKPSGKSKNKKNKKNGESKKKSARNLEVVTPKQIIEPVVITSQTNVVNNCVNIIQSASSSKINDSINHVNKVKVDEEEETEEDSASNQSNENLVSDLNQQEETIFKVNINKSTEESVFQTLPKQRADQGLISISTTIQVDQTHQNDLNSTVLDSEEILSNYEAVSPVSKLELNNKHAVGDNKSINKLIEASEVLADVTNNLLIQVSAEQEKQSNLLEAQQTDKNEEAKKILKKKKNFNFFSKSSSSSASSSSKIPDTQLLSASTSPSSKRKNDKIINSLPNKHAKKDVEIVDEKLPQVVTNIHAPVQNGILFLYYDFIKKFSEQNLFEGIRHQLLDNEQKERIIFMKPICVDLLLSEFESSESISNSIQLAKLSLHTGLRKMISRSLDLLRHDKIETFDKLAEQLKLEYKINDENDFESVTITLSDFIFKILLKSALIEKQILLKLELDKLKCQPYEKVIEFDNKFEPSNQKVHFLQFF